MTADQNNMEGYEVKLPADRAYVVLVKELTLVTTCERHVYCW
jgi:GTP cyclohydrolase I